MDILDIVGISSLTKLFGDWMYSSPKELSVSSLKLCFWVKKAVLMWFTRGLGCKRPPRPEHVVSCPRGIIDPTQSLDFFQPVYRVALLEVLYFVLIVLGATKLAFVVDVISETFELHIDSLTKCFLVIHVRSIVNTVLVFRGRT